MSARCQPMPQPGHRQVGEYQVHPAEPQRRRQHGDGGDAADQEEGAHRPGRAAGPPRGGQCGDEGADERADRMRQEREQEMLLT